MSIYIDELNEIQHEAVTTTDGSVLVLAGAGTGKTRVITYRIAYLIKELEVTAGNILAVTFTNKAAGEMKHRLNQLVGNISTAVHMGTFHSICLGILRKEGEKVGISAGFGIIDQDDRVAVVRDVMKRLDMDTKKFNPKQYSATISSYKNTYEYVENMTPPTDGLLRFGEVFHLYQESLAMQRLIDFDDMISLTVRLLASDESTRKEYQELYQYILVDEYQDTNMVQFKLLYLLNGDNGNLCVVGDDDQSIYGWRGAEIRNILEFDTVFEGVREIKLVGNYRSGSQILDLANRLIKNNNYRRGKTLDACKNVDGYVERQCLQNEAHEADFVAKTIMAEQTKGANLSDIAILYRTNSQSRSFELALNRSNVPYKVLGGTGFYQRREVKDILSYLRFFDNRYDVAAFKRSIKTPSRGIGDVTIEKIVSYSSASNIDIITAIKDGLDSLGRGRASAERYIELFDGVSQQPTIKAKVEYIVESIKYQEYLDLIEAKDEAEFRMDNVRELYSAAAEFEENNENVSLSDFLSTTSLITSSEEDSQEGVVKLMSIHAAKGLEFPIVFLTGLEENLFPLGSLYPDSDCDIEEERRLCYVGITRAMDSLFVTNVFSRMRNGNRQDNKESRFLKEMFASRGNSVNYSTGGRVSEPISGESRAINNSQGKFKVSDKVEHNVFGDGLVLSSEGSGVDEKVTVQFKKSGIKKILAGFLKYKV